MGSPTRGDVAAALFRSPTAADFRLTTDACNLLADAVLALLAEAPQPRPVDASFLYLRSANGTMYEAERLGYMRPGDDRRVYVGASPMPGDFWVHRLTVDVDAPSPPEAPQPRVLTGLEEEIATSAGVRITEDMDDADLVLMTGLLMIIDRLAPRVIEDTAPCVCGPRNDDPGDPDPDCPQHGHLTQSTPRPVCVGTPWSTPRRAAAMPDDARTEALDAMHYAERRPPFQYTSEGDLGRMLDAIPPGVLARLAVERGGMEQCGYRWRESLTGTWVAHHWPPDDYTQRWPVYRLTEGSDRG